MAGQGQAPARRATLKAGLPKEVGAPTLTKMCGSGMKAVMLAHDAIVVGSREGTGRWHGVDDHRGPTCSPKGRQGYRYGHATVYMTTWRRTDWKTPTSGQGNGRVCRESRRRSMVLPVSSRRLRHRGRSSAQAAIADGSFKREVAPVTVKGKAGDTEIASDEQPPRPGWTRFPH